MNHLKTAMRIYYKFCLSVGLFLLVLPHDAFAGNEGGIYFVAFVKRLVLYILIFTVITITALISRKKEVKLFLCLILLLMLIVPLTSHYLNNYKNRRIEYEDRKIRNESNNEFAQFCSKNQFKMYKSIKSKQVSSIYVRVIKPFAGDIGLFRPGYISSFIKAKGLCHNLGLKYIEGNDHEQRWRKYDICGISDGKLISKITARYELIIDGSTTTSQIYWEEMNKNQIRIIDKMTGEVLAEDTIFFLGNKTGVAGCPDATYQVVNLIKNVFGK